MEDYKSFPLEVQSALLYAKDDTSLFINEMHKLGYKVETDLDGAVTSFFKDTTPTQQQLDTFVNLHIIYSQTGLVQQLFEENFLNLDLIENFYFNPCTECGGEIQSRLFSNDFNHDLTEKYQCTNCEQIYSTDEYEELPTECKEVYEWYIVSDWLLEQLEKNNQPILKTDYQNYWGRTTTGQAISLDYVIEKIYTDNNITL